MNFSVYFDYKITVKNKYCYINEDGDHATEDEEVTKTIDGGKLADFIAQQLKDWTFSSISTKDNEIIISLFDPMDGTGQDLLIKIEEEIANEK